MKKHPVITWILMVIPVVGLSFGISNWVLSRQNQKWQTVVAEKDAQIQRLWSTNLPSDRTTPDFQAVKARGDGSPAVGNIGRDFFSLPTKTEIQQIPGGDQSPPVLASNVTLNYYNTRTTFDVKIDIGRAAAETLVREFQVKESVEQIFSNIISKMQGHHQQVQWITNDGVTYCVLPSGGGGSRLTYNFSRDPFSKTNRNVEFRLLNVSPADRMNVYWQVKADKPNRQDRPRQVDPNHKTRDGDTILVTESLSSDFAYYLAGRWEQGAADDWFRRNPKAAVLMVLR